MAENLHRLREDLDCSICMDMFEDPVALPECQHVYCRQCVESLIDTSRGKRERARCPECRCPIKLKGSLADLPGAYRLGAIVKKIRAQLRDIEQETTSEKTMLAKKIKECEDARTRVLDCSGICVNLGTSFKRKTTLRLNDIQKVYDKALEELMTWRKLAEKEVAQLVKDVMSSHDNILGLLNQTKEEIGNILAPSKSLMSAPGHQFLKDSSQLRTRMDNHLETWRKVIKGIESDLQMFRQSVEEKSVTSRYLRVTECSTDQESAELTKPKHLALTEPTTAEDTHAVATGASALDWASQADLMTGTPTGDRGILTPPQMVFSKVSDNRLQISGEGTDLAWTNTVPYQSYDAWTSAELKAKCFYWEVTFSVRYGAQLDCGCGYAAGVVQPGFGLRDNPGRNSWYVGITYSSEGISYYSCDPNNTVREPYRQSRMRVGPRRLGLCMDCSRKTLTIVDPDENQILCALGSVDVSRPLIPAVRFLTTCPTPRRMSAHLVSDTLEKIPAIVQGLHNSLRY